jgi:hypothetical protein
MPGSVIPAKAGIQAVGVRDHLRRFPVSRHRSRLAPESMMRSYAWIRAFARRTLGSRCLHTFAAARAYDIRSRRSRNAVRQSDRDDSSWHGACSRTSAGRSPLRLTLHQEGRGPESVPDPRPLDVGAVGCRSFVAIRGARGIAWRTALESGLGRSQSVRRAAKFEVRVHGTASTAYR